MLSTLVLALNNSSSRQKYTNKEIKKDYRLEEYLKIVRNPAHRISMTKTWLGVHTLRIQTGKYENKRASIPAEERLCLVYKRNCIEDEKHFLIDCTEYNSLRQKLYFWNDANFINLTDHARTIYLLRLDNDNTSQVIAKYAHLLFQKRKQILIVVSVHILYEFVVVMKTFIVTRPMPSFWRVRRNKDILYFTILHYTILHYTTLYYIILPLPLPVPLPLPTTITS